MSYYTAYDKIYMIEKLLPQLNELLSIVRDHTANLIETGIMLRGDAHIYSRDKKALLQGTHLYFNNPNDSFQEIDISYESRLDWDGNAHHVPYIKWTKNGVNFYIRWRISQLFYGQAITKKFWFFRWKKEIPCLSLRVTSFAFTLKSDNGDVAFVMSYDDQKCMTVDLHNRLSNVLAALYALYEKADKYRQQEHERINNEDKINDLSRFGELMKTTGGSL